MSPAVFSLWILIPNRQVPKGVGTEMRAMVASWGLLLHNEGAWGAVGDFIAYLGVLLGVSMR